MKNLFNEQQSVFSKGFTLIELLVVITIIGMLIAAVIAAFSPAKTAAQDSVRKDTIQKLVQAMQAYTIYNNSQYPDGSNSWITDNLVGSDKYLATTPNNVPYSGSVTVCARNSAFIIPTSGTWGRENGYCYATDSNNTTDKKGANTGTKAIIYTRLQVASCPSIKPNAYFLWSSTDGRTGITCTANNASSVPIDPSAITGLSGYCYLGIGSGC